MQMLYLEQECLRLLVDEYRQKGFSRVTIPQVMRRLPDIPYAEILTTFEKLESLGLATVHGDSAAKRHQMVLLLPTGNAHLYLEGRLEPVRPGHVEVVVQLDRIVATQLCEAVAGLARGQGDLVEAVRTIAEELKKPPEASATDKIQTATNILSLAASNLPLIQTVLLPAIKRLMAG